MFGFLLAFSISIAHSQDAPAGARLRLDRSGNTDWPAQVGICEIWPCLPSGLKFNVQTADGQPVHAQTVWSATGEPTLIRFDTSSHATTYYLSFDTNVVSAPGGWNAEAGLVVETRAGRDMPVDTMDQVNRLVTSAEPTGRSYVPEIFLGINPHGPSTEYVALFTGWFTAPRSGDYEFATVSSGPSYLQVDGHRVAEWLGRHDPHGGRRGQHSGRISLKPGVHHIDYLQVQLEGEPAAVAAWRPPGADRLEVIPGSSFVPVARFHAVRFDPAPDDPGQVYAEWRTTEHTRLGDALLAKLRFRAVPDGRGRSYRWRFDDGEEVAGADVDHYFVQSGMRQVLLEAREGGVLVATNALRVRVAPRWLQREDWRQDIFEDAKRAFLRRDLASMPARDVAELESLAERADDDELVHHVGAVMIRRADDFNNSGYATVFFRLGLSFQHQGDAGDKLAEQSLRLALAPTRTSPYINEKARIQLANLLIHCDGSLDEAQQLLSGLSGNGLSNDDKRLGRLLRADLLLARGQVDEARQQYQAIGDLPSRASGRFNIGRSAVLENARLLLERGSYPDAEQALDRFTFETPLERMSVETALVRVGLTLKQKAYRRAYSACRAILPAAPRNLQRADLLGALVESGMVLGHTQEARDALRELLKDYPYSEPAAKAKAR